MNLYLSIMLTNEKEKSIVQLVTVSIKTYHSLQRGSRFSNYSIRDPRYLSLSSGGLICSSHLSVRDETRLSTRQRLLVSPITVQTNVSRPRNNHTVSLS